MPEDLPIHEMGVMFSCCDPRPNTQFKAINDAVCQKLGKDARGKGRSVYDAFFYPFTRAGGCYSKDFAHALDTFAQDARNKGYRVRIGAVVLLTHEDCTAYSNRTHTSPRRGTKNVLKAIRRAQTDHCECMAEDYPPVYSVHIGFDSAGKVVVGEPRLLAMDGEVCAEA